MKYGIGHTIAHQEMIVIVVDVSVRNLQKYFMTSKIFDCCYI